MLTLPSTCPRDTEQVSSLVVDDFEEYRGISTAFGAHKETPDSIRKKIVEGGGFIAYIHDKAAGCVLYERYEPKDALYLGRRLSCRIASRASHPGRNCRKRAQELNIKVTLSVRVQLPQPCLRKPGIPGCSTEGYSEPTFITLESYRPGKNSSLLWSSTCLTVTRPAARDDALFAHWPCRCRRYKTTRQRGISPGFAKNATASFGRTFNHGDQINRSARAWC
jgi:hypothetical protein